VEVTTQFLGHKEILAVELINEPWAGDADRHPELLIPSVADKLNLQVAYDDLAPAIWAVDPTRLVMFAAVTWDDPVPCGFEHAPGGEQNNNRSVFAYHFYLPPQFEYDVYFEQRTKDAERLGTGLMLTEFGGSPPIGDSFQIAVSKADEYLTSWAFWEWKSFCTQNLSDPYEMNVTQWDVFGSCKTGYGSPIWEPDGSLNQNAVRAYSRTYAQAVAGQTQYMNFDPLTGVFQLKYIANPSIDPNTAPTSIWLGESEFYANGYRVSISPSGAATWNSPQVNYVNILHSSTATNLEVTIQPN